MFEMAFRKELTKSDPDSVADTLWQEIVKKYTQASRHYHTLLHLDAILNELLPLEKEIEDWSSMIFAIAYHDIIYNVLKKDNEEKSADLAFKRLIELNIEESRATRCSQLILATKNHSMSTDPDFNYFTDADLSILGKESNVYKNYCQQIRKEYKYYPDILYKPGRQKVLLQFLGMKHIYKTSHFQALYEEKARKNMEEELVLLK